MIDRSKCYVCSGSTNRYSHVVQHLCYCGKINHLYFCSDECRSRQSISIIVECLDCKRDTKINKILN